MLETLDPPGKLVRRAAQRSTDTFVRSEPDARPEGGPVTPDKHPTMSIGVLLGEMDGPGPYIFLPKQPKKEPLSRNNFDTNFSTHARRRCIAARYLAGDNTCSEDRIMKKKGGAIATSPN